MAVFFTLPLRVAAKEPGWAAQFVARQKRLRQILGRDVRVGPEFTLDAISLQQANPQWFDELARILDGEGLPCTGHLPFWDLHPGSFDDNILRASRETLALALDRAARLRPRHLVGHLAFNPHDNPHLYTDYLDRCAATWRGLAHGVPEGCALLLENTHEEAPEVLVDVLSRLRDIPVGLCFDVGHWHCFNKGCDKRDLPRWLDPLSPYLQACHVHDNDGSGDQHCAPGQGCIPLGVFFAALQDRHVTPTLVLEAHGLDAIQGALQFLETKDGPWQAFI